MPLIVYLDTQDYINIFTEKDENGPNHRSLTEVLSFRDRNEIVIGFSFMTVLEFITKPTDIHKAERLHRGQLIADVCGPNAFPYFTELAKGAVFPNDGRWFPGHDEEYFAIDEIKRMRDEIWKQRVKNSRFLTPEQRNELSDISSSFALSRNQPNWDRNKFHNKGIPVPDEFIENHTLEKFMRGQCEDIKFKKDMDNWYSNPAEYSRLFYEYNNDRMNIIDEYFGNIKTNFGRNIEEAKNSYKNNTTNIDIETQKIIDEISIPEFSCQDDNIKLKDVLEEKHLEHFKPYLLQTIKSGYNFKPSDVIDLIQLRYAYDCDLFRCDKAMYNIFQNYKPFKNKLVRKISDLPKCIENRLSKPDS